MDLDALAHKVHQLEAFKKTYEPMLEAMLPAYRKHLEEMAQEPAPEGAHAHTELTQASPPPGDPNEPGATGNEPTGEPAAGPNPT